jgi:hypothetical protein
MNYGSANNINVFYCKILDLNLMIDKRSSVAVNIAGHSCRAV